VPDTTRNPSTAVTFAPWESVKTDQWDDYGSSEGSSTLYECGICAALVGEWGRDKHAGWHGAECWGEQS
jgi:hypothetical protein